MFEDLDDDSPEVGKGGRLYWYVHNRGHQKGKHHHHKGNHRHRRKHHVHRRKGLHHHHKGVHEHHKFHHVHRKPGYHRHPGVRGVPRPRMGELHPAPPVNHSLTFRISSPF